ERSRCARMVGHDRPESVVTIGQNTQLAEFFTVDRINLSTCQSFRHVLNAGRIQLGDATLIYKYLQYTDKKSDGEQSTPEAALDTKLATNATFLLWCKSSWFRHFAHFELAI
ncbi:hypothetical protein QN379_21605, partial [Glaciimonas sp. Gout2]|uniref:hypothetical protein n=1 Tax=Glaciimonas sp. Gout2 TaxID=3048625 RepID=UPI002B23E5C9